MATGSSETALPLSKNCFTENACSTFVEMDVKSGALGRVYRGPRRWSGAHRHRMRCIGTVNSKGDPILASKANRALLWRGGENLKTFALPRKNRHCW